MSEYKNTHEFLKRVKEQRRGRHARAHSAPAPASSTAPSATAPRRHVDACECEACLDVAVDETKKLAQATKAKLFYASNSSIVLIHAVYRYNGFQLTKSEHWNGFWTSGHLKSYVFQVRDVVR